MQVTLANQNVQFTGFNSVQDALAFRTHNGGRVFVSEKQGPVIWFNHQFTPSKIFCHPILKGLSGRLL